MSRGSVRTFLVSAKKRFYEARRKGSPLSFVIGNSSADLDSITAAIVYGYVHSSTIQARKSDFFMIPVTNIPSSDLQLRPELTMLMRHANASPADLITLDDLGDLPHAVSLTSWTLVDHNVMESKLGEIYAPFVAGVIDHHDDEHRVRQDVTPRIIEKSGSCNSLVVNYCRDTWDTISWSSTSVGAANGQEHRVIDDAAYTSTWDAQLAKLALGSILVDTVDMSDDSKVTDHDRKAVRYLTAKINASPRIGKDFDRSTFYSEINDAKSNLDGLSPDDILRKDYKEWTESSLTLGVSTVVQPVEYMLKRAPNFEQACKDFANNRQVDVYAIMTAYTDEQGNFHRQLICTPISGPKAAEACKLFYNTSAAELELEDCRSDTSHFAVTTLKVWNQKNVAASRKRVAPLIREAMRGIQKG